MKNNFQNIFKLGALLVFSFVVSTLSAQQTTGDVVKETDIDPGTTTTGGSVRVIDNKGTKKFLQVKNGLTIISNTTNDVTTTTWQLGGELSDSTDIDLNGNAFALQNVLLSTDTAATSSSVAAVGGGTGVGFTLLIRDEATGAIKKMLATDLIQNGHEAFTATAGQTAYNLTGSPVLPDFGQVWVYRNGAKLIAGTDYTISGSTITLVPNTTAPNDWAVYADDVIEVQFIK